ncbi:MAG: replicative DNA helicase [Phycisphaerales bacterium]|nr:replicative DNA helicase [Phycisphaerales bacterium]
MSGSVTRRGSRRDDIRDDRSLSDLFNALPPCAVEAEMSLLGSVILDPDVCGDVVQVIRGADDFSRPAHAELWSAILKLYDTHQSVDVVQLQQLMEDRGTLEQVGGLDYVVELADSVPSAANAVHYARIIREKSMVRQLIKASGDILREAYTNPESAADLLDEAEQRIFKIAQDSESRQAVELSALIREAIERLEASDGQPLTGVGTGYGDLDVLTGGFQPGELIILAARPSMGKTALALNIAEHIASRGEAVGVFSLEMSAGQLVQRVLASRSGVDGDRMRRNALRSSEFRALFAACDELRSAPMFIDDTPGLTLLQLRAKARRMKQQHGLNAIVIDYLQLMTSGHRTESRQQEVSEISRGVKALARELDVPVLCLSQLNRAAEQREGHRPRMSDLRESGSIEQDADVVMMLHREAYYHRDEEWRDENPDKVNLAELILAKQRNGPTGTVKLNWDSRSTCFREYVDAPGPGGGGSQWSQPAAAAIPPPTASEDDLPI